MIVLGIDTSCDETAVAVVADGRHVLSNEIYSQTREHEAYGGVVPEIASRKHLEILPQLLQQAVSNAGLKWSGIDRIAVTYGPGLATSLLIGFTCARALSESLRVPMTGVNHLQAHLYSTLLDQPHLPPHLFPALTLTASGGHTCLVLSNSQTEIQLLGSTLDDAAGEALDKGATILSLGYPGGPALERAAEGGSTRRFSFPRGLDKSYASHLRGVDPDLCFSFSGIKTSLLYFTQKHRHELQDPAFLRDTACCYQEAVMDALTGRVKKALQKHRPVRLACAGGVARNKTLQFKMASLASQYGIPLNFASPTYCTDNAAMVAGWAHVLFERGCDRCPEDIMPGLSITA